MKLRQARLADEIRDIVASYFYGGRLNDPRLQAVTITHVRLTADLQIATVFYRVSDGSSADLTDQESRSATEVGLERCSGLLRKTLAHSLRVRRVPELRFRFDESVDTGARIEQLLMQIR